MKPANFDNKLQHSIDLLRRSEVLALRYYPAGYFDLAVVDPPYGGANSAVGGGDASAAGLTGIKRVARTGGTWAAKYGKKL